MKKEQKMIINSGINNRKNISFLTQIVTFQVDKPQTK